MEKNMYQEAIADAKAVRASALANAKAAIQEAFEPKLQEMIKKTMEEEDYTEGMDEPMEEETSYEGGPGKEEYADKIDEDTLEETTLEEILAELEADDNPMEGEGDTKNLHEAEEEEEGESEEEEETEKETETEEEGEEPSGETKVVDITLEDLVDAIKAAMGSETPAPEMGADMGSDNEVVDLEEILAEIEEGEEHEEEDGSMKKELEEAKATINQMREELNEINLLNAKLLYVNKLFKSKTLSESQKVKVLNSFDKATTVKETKMVYNTLMESLQTPKKTALKESIGFASKAAGVAPKGNTVEADPFITRMQKLAGII
jgi:hypothetical protein